MRSIAIAFAVLTLGLAWGPVSGPAEAQTLAAGEVASISGRQFEGRAAWQGGDDRVWQLLFRADGVLVYSYDGQVYDNGRWVQNERLVTFHTNNYYAQYSGLIDPAGSQFRGTMYNRNGSVGAFEFQASAYR